LSNIMFVIWFAPYIILSSIHIFSYVNAKPKLIYPVLITNVVKGFPFISRSDSFADIKTRLNIRSRLNQRSSVQQRASPGRSRYL
jgi:hypothetical protein